MVMENRRKEKCVRECVDMMRYRKRQMSREMGGKGTYREIEEDVYVCPYIENGQIEKRNIYMI